MWIYKELEKRLCRCLYILFLTAASFADVCIFSVPPPSLGIVSVPRNWRYMYWLSITYICRSYILHRQMMWVSKSIKIYHQISERHSKWVPFVMPASQRFNRLWIVRLMNRNMKQIKKRMSARCYWPLRPSREVRTELQPVSLLYKIFLKNPAQPSFILNNLRESFKPFYVGDSGNHSFR